MRIPLHISGGKDVTYANQPVTQGVPFAEGALERGTPVRVVDDAGTAYPTQAQCLSTWKPDLRHVRWLLVDTQLSHTEGDGRRYFLECGEEPPAPEHPVTLEGAGQYLRFDTGALQLEVRNRFHAWEVPRETTLFGRCRVRAGEDWADLWTPDRAPYAYMVDAGGNEARTDGLAPAPQVQVEEHGPLRASICIRSRHAYQMPGPSGPTFCPYILRLHLYAGRGDLRLFHTFIFDQDPHAVALSAVGMRFPLSLGGLLRAAVGADDGGRLAHFATNFEEVVQTQHDDLAYECSHGDGGRMPGWASLSGRLGGVMVAVKDAWQEYPKGFGIDPAGIDVGIWPAEHDELLTFTSPFEEPAILFGRTRDEAEFKRLLDERPTAPLNLKSLGVSSEEDLAFCEEMLAKYGEGRVASHNDTSTGNGAGAAKTTEMLLRFSAEPLDDADCDAANRAFQEPLIAPAEPTYSCTTRAFGHFHHAGDPAFAEADAGLDFLVESVAVEPTERCGLYGMMRYGNMVCSHAPNPNTQYVKYKDTDPGRALDLVGPYNNEANDQVMAVWGNFLRTGRRDHLFLAQRYSRAIADVATMHAHPTPGMPVGLMHYHNAHVWSGGMSPSHTLVQGYLTDYYVTGNRRLLEVAREVADFYVARQEPCGVLSNRHGALNREFTGPLWTLLEVYRATWEARYGDLARRSLNWVLRAIETPGTWPVSVHTRGERGDEAVVEPSTPAPGGARDTYNLYESALRVFDSRRLRAQVIAEADHLLWEAPTDNFFTAEMAREMLTERSALWKIDDGADDAAWYWTGWGLMDTWLMTTAALAWDLTGDLKYAAYCAYYVESAFPRQAERCRRFADWRFTWICFGSIVPRLMGVVAEARERDAAGLARAEAEWKAERARLGRPVYEGPGVDFDRDTMDSNGAITNRAPEELPREAPPRPREPRRDLGPLSTEDHPAP